MFSSTDMVSFLQHTTTIIFKSNDYNLCSLTVILIFGPYDKWWTEEIVIVVLVRVSYNLHSVSDIDL